MTTHGMKLIANNKIERQYNRENAHLQFIGLAKAHDPASYNPPGDESKTD